MPKYNVVITGIYTVEAENIAQAHRISKKIKTIGEVTGGSRPKNNRDFVSYRVHRKLPDKVLVKFADNS